VLIQQHFVVLERDGYIQAGVLHKTAGRPVRSFVLTEAGINSFPKQYAWFSELILTDMKNEMGSEAFQRYLHKLGSNERTIEACNCIYHDLAQKHEEICEFDRTLMSSLLDKDIEHVECLAKGGTVCRFKIINKRL
jgi:predicted ArsR family transcriptional regulator